MQLTKEQNTIVRKAIRHLERSIAQNKESLIHPNLFSTPAPHITSSLHWNSDFPKRDLFQLLVAFQDIGCFVDENGTPISLAVLADEFSEILGVDMKYIYKEKNKISQRFKRGKLTDALVKILQK